MGRRGYVKIDREFFEGDFLWDEPRKFSAAEAWIDLLQSAAWKDHERLVSQTLVSLRRGDVLASERYLEERWGWSRGKVRRFLELLERVQRVTINRDHEAAHLGAIITVCGYDDYEGGDTSDSTRGDTDDGPGADQREEKKAGEAPKPTDSVPPPAAGGTGPQKAVKRRPRQKPERPSWSSRACDVWARHLGGTPPGARVGRALKPLIAEHGEERVLSVWDRYLAEQPGQYATPENFAAKFGHWSDPKPLTRQKPIPDEQEYTPTTAAPGF